jgi:predicted anti-sigma-YlaC factor YlaD
MKNSSEQEKSYGAIPLKCEEIQNLLTDYMSHELGEARSNLVREHLRICKQCRTKASEIQKAISILQKAAQIQTDIPKKLSDRHRERIVNAALHPLREWFYVHYISIVIFVIILLIGMAIIFTKVIQQKSREIPVDESAIPIRIGSSFSTNEVVGGSQPLHSTSNAVPYKSASE